MALISDKNRILLNVLAVSTAFMVLFTSFSALSSLQSSIHKAEGLGSASIAVIYAALVISSLFVPSFLIKKLTLKWTLVLSMICYSLYNVAQFYPRFYTLVPAAAILGTGGAALWVSKCAFMSSMAESYEEITGESKTVVTARFFGIFFMIFQSASIWGNLLSSFGSPALDSKSKDPEKDSETSEIEDNFKTDSVQLFTLTVIFLIFSLSAPVIIALFVKPVKTSQSDEKLSGLQLLLATLKLLKKPKQLLMIPLTIWSGLEQGFMGADFTAGFVSCALGVHNVGLVLITYGAFDASFSYIFGHLSKFFGRLPILCFGAILNAVLMTVMFLWTPSPEQKYVFFLIAGFWGMADAVWQTQINAFYGSIFAKDHEGAYSNYRLWESVGFLMAYILQTKICVFTKLWILSAFLLVGMIGYFVVEILVKRENSVSKR